MRVLRVSKHEFELDDGSIFPIDPPLKEELSVEEFQKHYDFASKIIGSSRKIRDNNPDAKKLD